MGLWSEAVRNKACLKDLKDSNLSDLIVQNLVVRAEAD